MKDKLNIVETIKQASA